ncbi:MAG: hypothetical protein ACLFRG_17430 [Desulfococcaceae bacterium]
MNKWVDIWKKASVSLKEIKRQELQEPDYFEKNFHVLDEMLQYACENATPRKTSGLVEMQRLFMKHPDHPARKARQG